MELNHDIFFAIDVMSYICWYNTNVIQKHGRQEESRVADSFQSFYVIVNLEDAKNSLQLKMICLIPTA